MVTRHSELECIFPQCSLKMTKWDLEKHIRRHLHIKQHRCSCGLKFYEPQQLFEHQEVNGDHFKLPDTAKDAYMSALVYRILKDCVDAQNRDMSDITMRLSACTSSTPCPTRSPSRISFKEDAKKQENQRMETSQEEHLHEKRSHVYAQNNVPQKNLESRKRVISTGLESSASDGETDDDVLKKKISVPVHRDPTKTSSEILGQRTNPNFGPIIDLSLSPKANKYTNVASPRRRAPSNTVKTSKVPHPSLEVRDVPCLLCVKKTLVKSDLETRRTHVADLHMKSFDFTTDYKKELVLKTANAFPDLPSDDTKCTVCFRTANQILSIGGRRNHVQQYHLPVGVHLPCPYSKNDKCRKIKFNRLEELNKHCVDDHKWTSHRDLEGIDIDAYKIFCEKKSVFNSKCSELLPYYFPVPPCGGRVFSPSHNARRPSSGSTKRSPTEVVETPKAPANSDNYMNQLPPVDSFPSTTNEAEQVVPPTLHAEKNIVKSEPLTSPVPARQQPPQENTTQMRTQYRGGRRH